MVMILCLMIYNIAQYRMRTALTNEKETLPDQSGKPTATPTLGWTFQMMEDVIMRVEKGLNEFEKITLFNLDTLMLKILRLFWSLTCEIDGTA